MFEDRRASFRGYQTVKEIALKARERGGVASRKEFNVVDYITEYLSQALGSRFELNLFPINKELPQAYVNFNYKTDSIKLNVAKLIWMQAKFNIPEARYILAHELGHVFMHRHDMVAFSKNCYSALRNLSEEERVEPQANLFADIFLVCDDFLIDYSSIQDIAEDFRVPIVCAERRLSIADGLRRESHRGEPLGDLCPYCANMTLVRSQAVIRCKLCGCEIDSHR